VHADESADHDESADTNSFSEIALNPALIDLDKSKKP
jgi:hypothetical protein